METEDGRPAAEYGRSGRGGLRRIACVHVAYYKLHRQRMRLAREAGAQAAQDVVDLWMVDRRGYMNTYGAK